MGRTTAAPRFWLIYVQGRPLGSTPTYPVDPLVVMMAVPMIVMVVPVMVIMIMVMMNMSEARIHHQGLFGEQGLNLRIGPGSGHF